MDDDYSIICTVHEKLSDWKGVWGEGPTHAIALEAALLLATREGIPHDSLDLEDVNYVRVPVI